MKAKKYFSLVVCIKEIIFLIELTSDYGQKSFFIFFIIYWQYINIYNIKN